MPYIYGRYSRIFTSGKLIVKQQCLTLLATSFPPICNTVQSKIITKIELFSFEESLHHVNPFYSYKDNYLFEVKCCKLLQNF